MNQAQFYERLTRYKMIASVKEAKWLEKAAEVEVSAAVLSVRNIGIIKRYVDFFKEHHLPVFLHLGERGFAGTANSRLSVGNLDQQTAIIYHAWAPHSSTNGIV